MNTTSLPRAILLIGGSGFVGSHLAQRLSAAGCRVRIPVRHLMAARHLAPLPTVELVEADVHDPASLAKLLHGMDAVINLVGILHSRSAKSSAVSYGPDFRAAHVELPQKLVVACRQMRVARLIQVSALGAAADAPSAYLRSKAAGEAALRNSGESIAWTIVQPSVIFGPGDSFLNLFAKLLRYLPVIALGGAHARFQPVYVGDVVEALLTCLSRPESVRQTYELAGPQVYTLAELVRYVGQVTHTPRPILPLPGALAWLQAAMLECLPGPLMSRDNLRSMQRDNVACAQPLPFGLAPHSLEAIAPTYLSVTKHSPQDHWRRQARRS